MNWTAAGEGERGWALKEELCWTHELLSSQAEFHALTARFKGFSGPVGSGKSAALCFEVLRECYLNRGLQGVFAAPTMAMLRDASLASLFGLMDVQDIDYDLRKSDGELILKAPSSTVLLRSLDEPERMRGTNLAWFGIDELSYTREEAWLRLEARLRDPRAEKLCGFGVWTPQGHDWLYKRFIQKPVSGYGCVRAKPFENRFVLASTPDYYERLESSYDPKFYRQEVLGEYLNSRVDRVYHCFSRAVHLVQHGYDPHKSLLWALDFNVAPMTSVLLQRDHGRLVVIDEIVLERATTEEACQEFENRYRGHAAGLEVFGDASGRNMHTTGTTDYTMLQGFLYRAGLRNVKIRVPTKNPPVLNRVHKVNALLTNALGEVRLEVNERCHELIKDFEEVMFKPGSGIIDKVRDPKRTHASDALGYAIWELFGEKASAGEMDKRLF
ncbi:MAG: terminase family protein [Acidobacteriaceae bacterium]|nr:terminase family protein [Acidobacteriaceae bacterium]MBV9295966.1 terminase family protein [Acidobacteriaceae bacterium]